jgi:hypothetical protein
MLQCVTVIQYTGFSIVRVMVEGTMDSRTRYHHWCDIGHLRVGTDTGHVCTVTGHVCTDTGYCYWSRVY